MILITIALIMFLLIVFPRGKKPRVETDYSLYFTGISDQNHFSSFYIFKAQELASMRKKKMKTSFSNIFKSLTLSRNIKVEPYFSQPPVFEPKVVWRMK